MASDTHTSTCPGCDKTFSSVRGYGSHLVQSKDPLCRAVYNKLGTAHRLYEHIQNAQKDDSDMETETAEDYTTMDNNFDQDIPEEPPSQEDEDEEDHATAEFENGWEPAREGAPVVEMEEGNTDNREGPDGEPLDEGPAEEAQANARRAAERIILGDGHGVKPAMVLHYTDKYPSSAAGGILAHEETTDKNYHTAVSSWQDDQDNPWVPFKSKTDWEVALWAKLRGPGSTAFSDLLSVSGVREHLNLSYKNSDELNKIIDNKLPGRPQFRRHEVVQNGEALEFYSRDIIECLRALWGDPDFAADLITEPERHYADKDMTVRMYHDMNTGKWWWTVQKKVQTATRRKNITIVPVIISSDKTQLTTFRGKQAYPVYLTIGNIPKHIRRKPLRQGQVLLGYLPTSKLAHITNKASRRRCLSNLFHHCMAYILKPLEKPGCDGIILTSGDGAARQCFPFLAAYVGDYPEQILVGLVKMGECPICPAPRNEIGDRESTMEPRDTGKVIEALNSIDKGASEFMKACASAGIKPVQCVFWKNLPYVDIYRSITPDILHQLYQGLLKHLIGWVRAVCSDAEIDARCRRFPPNHNIRLFMNGISHLSRVTGTEHDQISRFLLALVADIRLPGGQSNARLVRTVCAVLDFIYLARYPIHTSETLSQMDDALQAFHDNRDVFISLGVRTHFNIPKLHNVSHYHELIELFGTADNFNTENTERLHIDMAKDAYASTNFKDEFPQMTLWLSHKERVMQHEKYIRRCLETSSNTPLHVQKPLPSLIPERRQRMTKHPTHYAIPLDDIKNKYGATYFISTLSRFIAQYQNPEYSKAQVEAASHSIHIPFHKLSVFHRIKFVSYDLYGLNPLDEVVVDSIHIDPVHLDKYQKVVPGRFDTGIISIAADGDSGVEGASPVQLNKDSDCISILLLTRIGLCVGQIRCIFTLPSTAINLWFPAGFPHQHMAYVEWFTPFSRASVDRNTKLFKISRLISRGEQQVSIIPVSLICSSIHLFPKFGPQAPVSWASSNVLENASTFYVNTFADRFLYSTIY